MNHLVFLFRADDILFDSQARKTFVEMLLVAVVALVILLGNRNSWSEKVRHLLSPILSVLSSVSTNFI